MNIIDVNCPDIIIFDNSLIFLAGITILIFSSYTLSNFNETFESLYESVATHSNKSPCILIFTPVNKGLLSCNEQANDVLLIISFNFKLLNIIGFLTSSS